MLFGLQIAFAVFPPKVCQALALKRVTELQVLEGQGIVADITVPSKDALQQLDRLELDFALGCDGHMDAGA